MANISVATGKNRQLAPIQFNFFLVMAIVVTLLVPTLPILASRLAGSTETPAYDPAAGLQSFSQLPHYQSAQTCNSASKCALRFDGSSQYILFDKSPNFDTATFTFEAWFNWTGGGVPAHIGKAGIPDGLPLLVIEPNVASTAGHDASFFLGIQPSSKKLMAVLKEDPGATGSTGRDFLITGNSPVAIGGWHHVAVAFDGQTWELYLDGNLDASQKLPAPIMPGIVGLQHLSMAAAVSSSGQVDGFYQGALDEVRIWDAVRSQAEIQSTINQELTPAPGPIDQWSMNEGSGSELADSSVRALNGTAVNGPAWIEGSPFNLTVRLGGKSAGVTSSAITAEATTLTNSAPDSPQLISPATGQTDVSPSPSLYVTVTDPDLNQMTVTFYGRAVPANQPADFTLVALPDTQLYSKTLANNPIFNNQTSWIASQLYTQRIAFVTHLGDVVDDWNVAREWDVASPAMATLETAGIPYGISFGNADEDNYGSPPGSTFINRYFSASRFAGQPYYGGAFNGDNANSYQFFSSGGLDFIIIHLQFNFDYYSGIIPWVDNLLQTYSNRRAIVVTHYLLDTNNNFSPQASALFQTIKARPNLFLMLGGHLTTAGRRQDTGNDGHSIFSLRSDYQSQANGGNGWLRLMRFSPSENKIHIQTYSPYLNQYWTDAANQFDLDYYMNGTSFQVLGTVANVASGANASVTWANLTPGTQYQWYAVVNDGTATTTGPTWNFTTGTGSSAPVITTQPTNQTVTAGQSVTFSAAASGSPAPTVQWQVSTDGASWNAISGATALSYTFTTQAADNGKLYRAVFTNSVGSATTNLAILTVNTVPVVILNPGNQAVNAGQTASFTASASGSPQPTVQWQVSANGINWTEVSGATSSTYTFSAQAADNGKQYRAVFTNVSGSAASSAAALTVYFAPVVTVNPGNQTVNAGQPVNFSAAANGNPTPNVQWQVSADSGATWADISGATTVTYSFSAQASDNGKQYQAVFSNALGGTASASGVLTVNTPPVLIVQPMDQTVNAGQIASFTSSASGKPAPSVQWQVSADGATWNNISGATAGTYAFTAQSGDNNKQYHAVFTNSAGSATSSAALLTVNTAPVITASPSNQTVNAGNTGTFSASASGRPAPTVQWQLSIDNGVSWTVIPGATSPTYTFTAQALDNGNHYRAIFTNIAGSATSSTAILTVNTVPFVTQQPANQMVTAGSSVSFSAAASGRPTPTIQWQVSSDGSNWANISGATGSIYTFTTQSGDNGKQFRAMFTNTAGSTTTNAATLIVNTVPVITNQPANLTVNVGELATFTSAATGNPSPTIQWQMSVNVGLTWSDIPGATVSPYSFTPQAGDNGNQYRAVFTNTVASTISGIATLVVNEAPLIISNPANQTVTAGQTASFSAAASGSPTPAVQWQVSTDGLTWTNITGATAGTYSFTAQANDNNNQYHAVFTNSAGSVISNAAFLMVNTLPIITTQPASQTVIAGDTASFSTIASGSPAPTAQWQVSTNGGSTWSDLPGATSSAYSFTAQLIDTGKQFRAVFTNIAGSAASNAAVLTVHAASTPPVITVQPSSLTVNEGQSVSFNAAASGTPTPTVQWQMSTNGTNWTDVSGATSSTYTFTTQAADNGKQYHAVFTNSAGNATTNAATLTVNTLPVITTQPLSQTVISGSTASFNAAANGSPTPSVQWQMSTNGTTWSDITGAITPIYSFTAQASDNGHQFRVIFTNTVGSTTTNSATLTVNTVPVVTIQPVGQTVISGSTASFSAAASGSPTPTVQWQMSTDSTTWSDVTGASLPTYSFTAQANDNGNHYRAVFTNAAGSATTNAAILIVNTAPVVTTQPVSQTVNSGQSVSYTSAASGNPTPTVQWQVSMDGITWADILGAISPTYSFTSQPVDTGKQYRAVFINPAGTAASNPATLIVNTAPAITTQPASQTVILGSNASFTSAASGSPLPTVQWQGSVDSGSTWVNIAGATVSPYTFIAQLTDNGKQYRAVFTNAAGSATTNAVTLTVNTIPAITIQPASLTVNSGQAATFTAAASGSPAPTAQWQMSLDGITWNDIANEYSTTYTFTPVAADSGKQYRAVFTNPAGTATSNPATLTVNTTPAITTQPASQTVISGSAASFTAFASGSPTPTVQWQVSTNGTAWTDISGATSPTYSFTTQASDNGKQYRAVFTNSAGSTISNVALLEVNTVPAVTSQPASQTVTAGQSASFSAAASGNPAPTVQWQVSTDGGTTWSNISGATAPTYSFVTASGDSGKQYHAVFTSIAGSATTNAATLTVNTVPVITTQPATLAVTAGQTASFSAAASGSPAPTVQWQVSTDGGTIWINISGATASPYTFTAQVTDSGEQYRAVFTNEAGSATSNAAFLTVTDDLIFKDSFTSCNASGWPGGAVNPGALSYTTGNGYSGCGMAVAVTTNTGSYVVDTTPNAETRYRARFYFNPGTMRMANNDQNVIFNAYNPAGAVVATIQVRYAGGNFQIRAGLRTDANKWSYTSWSALTKVWRPIEIDWRASSAPGANNGGLTFWQNGVQVGALSATDNDQQKVDKAAMGVIEGIDSTTRGSFYFDEFVSRRLNYIGQ